MNAPSRLIRHCYQMYAHFVLFLLIWISALDRYIYKLWSRFKYILDSISRHFRLQKKNCEPIRSTLRYFTIVFLQLLYLWMLFTVYTTHTTGAEMKSVEHVLSLLLAFSSSLYTINKLAASDVNHLKWLVGLICFKQTTPIYSGIIETLWTNFGLT